MAGYYFIKSNGHLYRLTKKAYRTWAADSKKRLENKKSHAKLRNYGLDLGPTSTIKCADEFCLQDFVHINE